MLQQQIASAHRAAIAPVRTADVEFQKSYLPGTPLHWVLRCYGRGVCTIGTGVRNRFETQEAAERAGVIWMVDGVSPADQQIVARSALS